MSDTTRVSDERLTELLQYAHGCLITPAMYFAELPSVELLALLQELQTMRASQCPIVAPGATHNAPTVENALHAASVLEQRGYDEEVATSCGITLCRAVRAWAPIVGHIKGADRTEVERVLRAVRAAIAAGTQAPSCRVTTVDPLQQDFDVEGGDGLIAQFCTREDARQIALLFGPAGHAARMADWLEAWAPVVGAYRKEREG